MDAKNFFIFICLAVGGILTISGGLAFAADDAKLGKATYMPVVIETPFQETMDKDAADKQKYMKRHQDLLEERYDLSDKPAQTMMSGGQKAVQQGVRVKLHGGVTWEELAEMTPAEIKEKNLFPMGFRPLPHTKHTTGGQVSLTTPMEPPMIG
jgi:cytochrome c peroxidase